jgi:hypothetical protein
MHVKMTFMNGNLHDVVYFKQPPRFVKLRHEFFFANTLCFTWIEISPRVCCNIFLPSISRSYQKYSRYNLYYLKKITNYDSSFICRWFVHNWRSLLENIMVQNPINKQIWNEKFRQRFKIPCTWDLTKTHGYSCSSKYLLHKYFEMFMHVRLQAFFYSL